MHGWSEVIDHHAYKWHDRDWKGIPFRKIILYEMHVGTFTREGTFDAVIPKLDELDSLGINAIELMPVAQFPGDRNWGYDAVFPYAVQHSYGGAAGLKRLVDACHQRNIAVFLDVIYNHLGPEGNYFGNFGPYFTSKYKVPWGDAINFDGQWCDGVREYFSNNAVYWFDKFHIDGLRLDAIHTVFDDSAISFWQVLGDKVRSLEKTSGRALYLVAESDLNSPRVIGPTQSGGYGFDAQWLDDFHHALYTLLDPEGRKRYEDYGTIGQLVKAYREGFVLSGQWVKFRKKKFGASSADVASDRFVVFNQNHDQVGNRVKGERLAMLVDFDRLKIASAAILLSPYVPMLFMGEEYGEEQPFYYFVSHSEQGLIKAVREGRKSEFKNFELTGEFPDPQAESTFNDSRLKWENRSEGKHALLLKWHKALIGIRKLFIAADSGKMDAVAIGERGFVLSGRGLHCIFNLSATEATCELPLSCKLLLFSGHAEWTTASGAQASEPLVSEGHIKLPPVSVAVYCSRS